MKRKILIGIIISIVIGGISAAVYLVNQNDVPVFSKEKLAEITLPKHNEITLSPEPNEEIGTLYFPKVEMRVPVVYGYNADYMEQYFDVVGLEAWGNFPGQENKLYINGHRHLAFQNLKHVELGDTMILYMPYGEFTYQVNQEPQVVRANDKDALAFYQKDRDKQFSPQILRLQTCYPFEAGSTLDHRYLVDLVLTKSIFYNEE